MKLLRLIIIILSLLFVPVLSQQSVQDLELLNKKFQSFDYHGVIQHSDSLLLNADSIDNHNLSEIYRLKGISHYSLFQMQLALNSFVNLLKTFPEYEIDPLKNSPKIVSFFNEIKINFKETVPDKNTKNETPKEVQMPLIQQQNDIKTAIGYSIILPGSGQLHQGETTKGWSLMSAAVVTLGASVYFILDSDKKENDYLNESNRLLMDEKYNKYNDAYKLRNISLLSFAAIWIYAQLDLLVFDSNISKSVSLQSPVDFGSQPQLKFQISF